MAVEGEHVVDGEGLGELAEGAGQGERGRAHAVRDHENEVAFWLFGIGNGNQVGVTRGRVARDDGDGSCRGGRRGCGIAVLEDDSKDDDSGGGDEGPGEEDHLAQARSASWRSGNGSAMEGGIFFFGAAGRVFGVAGLVRQERSPLRSGGLRECV